MLTSFLCWVTSFLIFWHTILVIFGWKSPNVTYFCHNLSRFITIIYHDLSWFDTFWDFLTQNRQKLENLSENSKIWHKNEVNWHKIEKFWPTKMPKNAPLGERRLLHRFRHFRVRRCTKAPLHIYTHILCWVKRNIWNISYFWTLYEMYICYRMSKCSPTLGTIGIFPNSRQQLTTVPTVWTVPIV